MFELIPLEYMALEIEREHCRRRASLERMRRGSVAPIGQHANRRALEIAIIFMVALSLATLISAVA
jgi:hypothetical protein